MMTNTVTPQLKNEFNISAVCSKCKGIGQFECTQYFQVRFTLNATAEASSKFSKVHTKDQS